MSRERAAQLNTVAMMEKLQEMDNRLWAMQEKLDGYHAALATAMNKYSQLELMVTLQKAQLVGNGPTEV